jgi:hypothetical protein
MTKMIRTLVAAAVVLLCTGTWALAQPAAPPASAPAAEAPASASDLLARCDARLDRCEEHRAGMPYLAIAYMVLWVILLGFLLGARRSQRRLGEEIADLRRRLREFEGS